MASLCSQYTLGASKIKKFTDGSVGRVLSFAAPSRNEPIAHSELRLSYSQSSSCCNPTNQPFIMELYDTSRPQRLLDRKQVLPDTNGLNVTAFDVSRAIRRAHQNAAATISVMLKLVPAVQSNSIAGGGRVRRDTSAIAARNGETIQKLDAHMFTYVKDTERPSSISRSEVSTSSRPRTRRSVDFDPENVGGVFKKFLAVSTHHRFNRLKRQHAKTAFVNHHAIPSCGRRYLHVNFTQVMSSDLIVAPKSYVAWFCKGSCDQPFDAPMNATQHAILQAIMHHKDPRAVPAPCCVPTSLSGLTVLMKEPNDVDSYKVQVLKDMVVEQCGCR